MAQNPLRMKFRISADLAEMSLLRTRIRDFLSICEAPFSESAREEIILALDEATSNIIQHAYDEIGTTTPQTTPHEAACATNDVTREIDVEFAIEDNDVVIRLWDDGAENDPTEAANGTIDEADESGRGLFIMQATMTDLRYERTDDGRNLLVMRRTTEQSSWIQDGQ